MRVLVRGLGNIGTTLTNLLLRYQQALCIDEVMAHKTVPRSFLDQDLALLRARGARVLVGPDESERALAEAQYVFDCRKDGAPRAERSRYQQLEHVMGVCAQGTEVGFGAPFVTGANDDTIPGSRFVQVASCNTHALVSLLRGFAGDALDGLGDADFVVARRAEDIGNHERLVSGTVVARHRHEHSGTHHAHGAQRVFATIGVRPSLTSSDITTPSQLLHTVRFSLRFATPYSAARAADALGSAQFLACTQKFDSNRVFELGRRYGFQGRIYSHAIVVANNLLVAPTPDGGATVRGWAFVPQEGNTLLTTLHAYALQTEHPDPGALRARLCQELLQPDRW